MLIATTNLGKVREIQQVLGGLPIVLQSLADFPSVPEPEETGRTFAENARLKADYYSRALGVPTVVPWGPSDLPRNAPRGPEHTVIFKGLPCSPCYRMPGDSRVHLCDDHVCLSSIPVDEVAAAALGRLATSQTR